MAQMITGLVNQRIASDSGNLGNQVSASMAQVSNPTTGYPRFIDPSMLGDVSNLTPEQLSIVQGNLQNIYTDRTKGLIGLQNAFSSNAQQQLNTYKDILTEQQTQKQQEWENDYRNRELAQNKALAEINSATSAAQNKATQNYNADYLQYLRDTRADTNKVNATNAANTAQNSALTALSSIISNTKVDPLTGDIPAETKVIIKVLAKKAGVADDLPEMNSGIPTSPGTRITENTAGGAILGANGQYYTPGAGGGVSRAKPSTINQQYLNIISQADRSTPAGQLYGYMQTYGSDPQKIIDAYYQTKPSEDNLTNFRATMSYLFGPGAYSPSEALLNPEKQTPLSSVEEADKQLTIDGLKSLQLISNELSGGGEVSNPTPVLNWFMPTVNERQLKLAGMANPLDVSVLETEAKRLSQIINQLFSSGRLGDTTMGYWASLVPNAKDMLNPENAMHKIATLKDELTRRYISFVAKVGGTVRVRDISSGQTGSLLADKYDSAKYELIFE
jgi:hypothetical protein